MPIDTRDRRLAMVTAVYVRVSSRKTTSGQPVRYLQLAHNERDPVAKMSRTKVLHSFGREDDLGRAAVERLVVSLSRLLEPGRAAAVTGPAELVYLGSRPFGGTDVLDGLWRRLGLPAIGRWTGCCRSTRAGPGGLPPGHRPSQP
jgi:hypothetical protein